jgi:hypothetical protein
MICYQNVILHYTLNFLLAANTNAYVNSHYL